MLQRSPTCIHTQRPGLRFNTTAPCHIRTPGTSSAESECSTTARTTSATITKMTATASRAQAIAMETTQHAARLEEVRMQTHTSGAPPPLVIVLPDLRRHRLCTFYGCCGYASAPHKYMQKCKRCSYFLASMHSISTACSMMESHAIRLWQGTDKELSKNADSKTCGNKLCSQDQCSFDLIDSLRSSSKFS